MYQVVHKRGKYRKGTEGVKGGILYLIVQSSYSGPDCTFVLPWLPRFAASARLPHVSSLQT